MTGILQGFSLRICVHLRLHTPRLECAIKVHTQALREILTVEALLEADRAGELLCVNILGRIADHRWRCRFLHTVFYRTASTPNQKTYMA